MDRAAKPIPAALGFRVKSGWAMAVLLSGTLKEPKFLSCHEALLSDPKIPNSKQPYHAALTLSGENARVATQRLCKIVSDAAERSVRELLEEATAAGYVVRGAACVVGSLVDPATLHNEHIRAHGLEGQLFRAVLADALRAHEISCPAFLERGAYNAAAPALRLTVSQIKRIVAQLGESHDGSWRAEEKLAALAAWLALKSARNSDRDVSKEQKRQSAMERSVR